MRIINKASRFMAGVLIVAAAGTLIACGAGASDKELVERAKSYMAEKQVREASIELKNAIQANPENAEARFLLGELSQQIGDLASAEKEFQRALEMGWSAEAALIKKMRAMIAQRKYKEVLEITYETTGWTETAQANLLALKALAYVGEADLLQAKNIFLSAEELDAEAYDVLKVSVLLQLTEKQNKEAEATLSKARKRFPENLELMLMSANLAALNQQNEEAIGVFEQIIALSPDSMMTLNAKSAYVGILKLAVQQKDFDRVQKVRDVFAANKIDDPEVNYFLAVSAFAEKNLDQAEEYLQKILNISTSHGPTLLLSGSVSFAKRDFEKAAYYLSKYVANFPENNKARKLLGRAYLALGQHEEAQAEFNAVLNKNADDAELIALLGLSEISSGQVTSGIAELEKALAMAPDSSSLKLQLAKAYITDGQTEQAIKQLDEIPQTGDNNEQIALTRVLAYLQSQNIEMAMETAEKMLHASPDNPDIFSLMGTIQLSARDMAVARKYFNQALAVNADHINAEMNLARLDEQQGDITSAEKRYLSILNKKPENITVMTSLARLAAQQGDEDKQIKWLEAARKADDKELAARLALVDIYLKEENIADTEVLISELGKAHAGNPAVLAARGKLFMVQKRFTQAESVFLELVRVSPELDTGYYLLARSQLALGDKATALENLRKAYSLKPGELRNIFLLASLEHSTGNHHRAIELAEQIIRTAPDSATGYTIKGNAQYALQQYKPAMGSFDKAWTISKTREIAIARFKVTNKLYSVREAIPILSDWLKDHADDKGVLLELGVAYLTDKQYENATTTFEKILSLQPDNIMALNNLAWLYGQDNNPRALGLAEKAHLLSSDSPGIMDTYGWVLVQQGQVAKGRKLLEQALDKLQDVPEVQYHYAIALLKSGEEQEARQMLEKLLESGKPFEGREDAQGLLD